MITIWDDIKYVTSHCFIKTAVIVVLSLCLIIFCIFWMFDKLPSGFNLGSNVAIFGVLMFIIAGVSWSLYFDKSCWPENEEKEKLIKSIYSDD